MDLQEAKNVIAHFLQIDANEIHQQTVMNNKVISSSLKLHRMYSVLADRGFVVPDPSSIVTYGDFLSAVNEASSIKKYQKIEMSDIGTENFNLTENPSIGIDIEFVPSFEQILNQNENHFLKSNYTTTEIEYCLSRVNPSESFAGLFAAKEALVKANIKLKDRAFKDINIEHDMFGKPTYKGFSISISHSSNFVVAVAMSSILLNTSKNIEADIESLLFLERNRTNNIITISALVFFIYSVFIFWLHYDFL